MPTAQELLQAQQAAAYEALAAKPGGAMLSPTSTSGRDFKDLILQMYGQPGQAPAPADERQKILNDTAANQAWEQGVRQEQAAEAALMQQVLARAQGNEAKEKSFADSLVPKSPAQPAAATVPTLGPGASGQKRLPGGGVEGPLPIRAKDASAMGQRTTPGGGVEGDLPIRARGEREFRAETGTGLVPTPPIPVDKVIQSREAEPAGPGALPKAKPDIPASTSRTPREVPPPERRPLPGQPAEAQPGSGYPKPLTQAVADANNLDFATGAPKPAAPVPAPKPEAEAERVGGWQNFARSLQNNPQLLNFMMGMGLQLMQPSEKGIAGALSDALATGYTMMGISEQARRRRELEEQQQAREEQRLGLEGRRVTATERQGDLASERLELERTGQADERTYRQGMLQNQQAQVGLLAKRVDLETQQLQQSMDAARAQAYTAEQKHALDVAQTALQQYNDNIKAMIGQDLEPDPVKVAAYEEQGMRTVLNLMQAAGIDAAPLIQEVRDAATLPTVETGPEVLEAATPPAGPRVPSPAATATAAPAAPAPPPPQIGGAAVNAAPPTPEELPGRIAQLRQILNADPGNAEAQAEISNLMMLQQMQEMGITGARPAR